MFLCCSFVQLCTSTVLEMGSCVKLKQGKALLFPLGIPRGEQGVGAWVIIVPILK